MERPAFWKVPRDLSVHQLSEAEEQTNAVNKPALASLASYSIGFANLGLKVQSGSAADGVVQRGDLVRKIGDYDSRDIRHQDVQTLFKNAGPTIKLVVSREHRGSAPVSAPGSRASSVPPVLPTHPPRGESPYIMAGLNPALIDHPRQFTASPHRLELQEEMNMVTDQPYRTTPLVLPGAKVKKDAAPTESYLRHHPNPLMRAPPPPHGINHEVFMKQKVAQQFNSPIGLYSEDNIVNTIVQQTGATPIVFPPPSWCPSRLSYKKTVVYDPAKSETYRALKESEYGDTVQEIPTPVEPKVFSPAKVNTKRILPPKPPINSVGAYNDSIQQSNSFKRLMQLVLEEN